jgi:hypothetical protein
MKLVKKQFSASSMAEVLKGVIGLQQQTIQKLEDGIKSKDPKKTLSAASDLMIFGQGWNRADNTSLMGLGQVISVLREGWEELPLKFTSQYENSFDQFIQESFTLPPSKGHSLANRWEALLSGQYDAKIPRGIDVYALNSGRLSMATELVLEGNISKKKWEIISDENLTNKQIASRVFGSSSKKTKRKRSHVQMLSRTGELRVILVDGTMEDIGHLTYNTKNLVVRKEIERIISELRIEIVP